MADAHAALMEELTTRGPMHIAYPDEEMPRRTASIDRIASFLSVGPGDLALTRGVSEAFQTVLRGLDWCEGDEILITAQEASESSRRRSWPIAMSKWPRSPIGWGHVSVWLPFPT